MAFNNSSLKELRCIQHTGIDLWGGWGGGEENVWQGGLSPIDVINLPAAPHGEVSHKDMQHHHHAAMTYSILLTGGLWHDTWYHL